MKAMRFSTFSKQQYVNFKNSLLKLSFSDLMSCNVLRFFKRTGKGKLSELLENKKYLERCGGSDNVVAEIDTLTAKGFLRLKHEYDVNEGDDFIIEITTSGEAFLRYKEKKK